MPDTKTKREAGDVVSPVDSLRERKKAMTRSAIEKAVLELVVEEGYDNVTIDGVCERSSISRKTFFNYFASKDAAILGSCGTRFDEERLYGILEANKDETNYLDALVAALQITWTEKKEREEIANLRRTVLSRWPQILFQARVGIPDFQDKAHAALKRFLEAHPERRVLPEHSVEEESMVAASAVINIARTRACLSVHGERVLSAKETRKMVHALVSAGI